MARVSGRKLAKELGVSPTTVRKMRDKCQITPVARAKGNRGEDLYDLDEVKRQRKQNVRTRVLPGEGDQTIIKLQKAKLVEEVKAKRMENERKRGEYRPVGELRAFLASMKIAVRDILLAVADQPHLGLDARQRELVREEHHRALHEIARTEMRLLNTGVVTKNPNEKESTQ